MPIGILLHIKNRVSAAIVHRRVTYFMVTILLFVVPAILPATPTLRGYSQTGSLTLNTGENQVMGSVIDTLHGYAYFSTFTPIEKVVKVSLFDFSRAASLAFSSDQKGYYLCGSVCSSGSDSHAVIEEGPYAVIDPLGGFAYFAAVNTTLAGRIVQVRLSNFTISKSLILMQSDGTPSSAVIDPAGGYAYFGTEPSGVIIKIRLSDFTRVASLTLNAGEGGTAAAAIDLVGGYAYFGTDASPARVAKISLSTFKEVGPALILNVGQNDISSAVLDLGGGFGYFGTSTAPGIIAKISLSSFTEVASLTLNSGEDYLSNAILDYSGGFAYFAPDAEPGALIRIRLSDFTRAGSRALSPGGAAPIALLHDPTSGYAYIGLWTTPETILKVQIASASSAPQGVSAISGSRRITLVWSPPALNGDRPIQRYKVYRSTSPGGESSGNYTAFTIGNLTTFTDNSISTGTPYFYKVSALNNFGESPLSTEASASSSSPTPVFIPTVIVVMATLIAPIVFRMTRKPELLMRC